MKKLRWIMMGLIVLFVMRGAIAQDSSSSDEGIMLTSSDINGVDQDRDQILLSDLLSTLEQHFDVTFLYNDEVMVNKYVNRDKIKIGEEFGRELSQILDQLGIAFQQIDKQTYVLLNKELSLQVAQVQEDISGTVTDAQSGETLPGVNVMVKGTTTGTSTDANGGFELTVESLQDTLIFSFVGYQSQEVPINGRTKIDVILQPQAIAGEELVVVGYGTQSKRNITSSISSITSENLENTPVQQMSQALQGKVAGVQIIHNSGAPGSNPTVRIRGTGTVNNSEPLYVIDGNPGADPTNLSPNQIESIEVLKSSSAAAIYGARGANGVILITTKSGIEGTSNLQVNYYKGVQQLRNAIPMMTARQNAITYNQALVNAGIDPLYEDIESLGKGTDWQDAIYRAAPLQNIDVSFSGGSEQGTYYIGAGYYQQKGIVINTDYKRATFRINSKYDINSLITVGENLSLSYSNQRKIPSGQFGGGVFGSRSVVTQALRMDPSSPVKNPDGSWGFPKFSDARNPVAQAYTNHKKTAKPTLNGSMYVNVTPLKNFVLHSQVNMNLAYTQNSEFIESFNVYPIQQNLVPKLSKNNIQYAYWDWNNTLTFEKSYKYHDIEVMGGVTVLTERIENMSARGQGITDIANENANLRYLDLVTDGQVIGGSAGEYSMLSFLGRINYGYKDTYLFTGNFRIDGSSKFGKNNRYGVFPSFSVGWRISNEAFMDDISFIDDLKIRGGWGEIGNQNTLPNYAFTSSLTPNLVYAYGPAATQGQAPVSIGNPNLKWETTTETDLGFDLRVFKRVTLSASYYYRKTSDMLLRVPIMVVTGIQQPPFTNGGSVVNKGLEFSLGYDNTTPSEFNYDISVNFSRNINEVTKLSNEGAAIFAAESRTIVGEPIASFYGYFNDGVFQTEQEVENSAFQTEGTSPGDLKFRDINNDDVINQQDRGNIGNPWPDFTYGLTSNFNWKQFDLSLALSGTVGNEIWADWKQTTQGSNFYNYDTAMLSAWNGKGSTNKYPRLHTGDPNDNFRGSSYYVEDGSYVRLKNIQIGYTLPSELISSQISNLRIYFSGQNIWTFTKYRGYDPEVGGVPGSPLNIAVDNARYPQARIFTLGLRLSIH